MLEAEGMKYQKVGLNSLMNILKFSETNRISSELLWIKGFSLLFWYSAEYTESSKVLFKKISSSFEIPLS
jgi:ferric iron reductase protein FhuF